MDTEFDAGEMYCRALGPGTHEYTSALQFRGKLL